MITGNDVILSNNIEIKRPDLCKIGNHVAIDFGFYCTTALNIGDYVHIGPHVSCIGGRDGKFELHGYNNVMAGARIICCSDRFDNSGLFGALVPDKFKGKQIKKPVVLERFSNVGTNAIILPGSILRQGVLVAAGSLLMGDTVPWGVYKGNPAKLTKIIDSKNILEMVKQNEL